MTTGKSGEGSKGGHVIGHTSSGKPIYSGHDFKKKSLGGSTFGVHSAEDRAKFSKMHEGWTAQDHKDAMKAHDNAQSDSKSEVAKDRHYAMQSAHRRAAQDLTPAHEVIAAQDKMAAALTAKKEAASASAKQDTAAGYKGKYDVGHEPGSIEPYMMKKGVTNALGAWLHDNTETMMKSMTASGPVTDLCKCGAAMKKGDDGMCKGCGKPLAKSETTGVSSDFGGNPESTDVRAVVEMEKGIPGADAPDPEEASLGGVEGDGDPEGKNLDTSDSAGVAASEALLKKGLRGWLTKAGAVEGGDEDAEKPDDEEEEKPDEENADLEKAGYIRRTGAPGNYRYEYAHAHPGAHKDRQDLSANEGHLRGGQYDKKIPGLSDENAKKNVEGLKAALENKHKLMQKWASGEHAAPPDLQSEEVEPGEHLKAADEAEAKGDKDLAVAHHIVGAHAHDERMDAAGDWERGDPVTNRQFLAHNDALKRLGHEAHEPNPEEGKRGVSNAHIKAALTKVKATGFSSPKFDGMADFYLKKSRSNSMNAFQKNGLAEWMKSNIPGAEDTSGGKGKDHLAERDPPQTDVLEQGADVNGPMLDLDGMGEDNTAQAGSNTLATTTGTVNAGNLEKLSEDDPALGEMASGAPGLVSKTPEAGGNIGQGKGTLSKSYGFIPDAADLRDQQMRARILAARGQPPADLRGVGVGRAAPAQQRPAQAAPSVVRKGQVAYSDASDLAVEQLMKSEGAGALDLIGNTGPLMKSEQCGSCGSGKPVWLSTCPTCGGIPQSRQQLAKSQIPQGRLRLRVERDLVLPEGTKKG